MTRVRVAPSVIGAGVTYLPWTCSAQLHAPLAVGDLISTHSWDRGVGYQVVGRFFCVFS